MFANDFNLLASLLVVESREVSEAGVPILSDGSTINNVAINVLRAPGPQGGVNNGFYVPSLPFGSNGLPVCNPAAGLVGSCSTFSLSDPSSRTRISTLAITIGSSIPRTLSRNGTFTPASSRRTQSFVCLGPCQPRGARRCNLHGDERGVETHRRHRPELGQ